MSTEQREDVNDVLNDVIDDINRITSHVREQGENEAANSFTQEMTATLRKLYITIAPWDIDKCLMKCDTKSHRTPATQGASSQSTKQLKCVPTPSPGTTWAAIAATEPAADKNGIIKFRPSDGIQVKAVEQNVEHRTDSKNPTERRVVWIRPWTVDRPLKDITKKMQNLGAIYSIAFDPGSAAICIIFQQATCAMDFMRRCAQHVEYYGRPLLGTELEIAPGLPYPLTKELVRMDAPYNERRRLTFARAGLFTKDGVSQQQFEEDIASLVGDSNIELTWYFNSGNATVVFSAVPLSKIVRDTFLRYGLQGGSPYHGIMVTYSHDPCERDMHLVSQIPGHAGYIGGNNLPASGSRARGSTFGSNVSGTAYGNGGNGHYTPAHKRRITGSNGPKPNIDNDGWETVKKRR